MNYVMDEAEFQRRWLELRSHADRHDPAIVAMLNDESFMRGVVDSMIRIERGEVGEPWEQVKVRLGID